MAKHTKEKPLKCSICDWSTCYNGNLWKHMQMHKLQEGILLPGKPKRATRKGIRYEEEVKRFGKLLPITMDGFREPTAEEKEEVREIERTATSLNLVNIPLTISGLGEATIMVVPANEGQQQIGVGEGSSVVTLETGQRQTGNETHMVSFKPANPNVLPQVHLTPESNAEENSVRFEVEEQSQESAETGSGQEQEVMISVAGGTDNNVQQSISSIMTSMAASAAAAASQPTTTNADGNTLIETQLSASEVASQFEDGTIIEITQIPTSGDGTALIPEGAIVEKISPGMSASDIIMKAANMVAAGQVSRSASSEYLIPMSLSRTHEGDVSENTLPFLAHVATAQAQESLPETTTLQIVEGLGEENEEVQETGDSVSQGEVIEHQGGMIEEQLVATMLPDGSNVMQLIQPQTQDDSN